MRPTSLLLFFAITLGIGLHSVSFAQVAGFSETPTQGYTVSSTEPVNLRTMHSTQPNQFFLTGEWSGDLTFTGWTTDPQTYAHAAHNFAKLFFAQILNDQFYAFLSIGVASGQEVSISNVAVGSRWTYLLGSFSGTLRVDQRGQIFNVTSQGDTDAFLIRLNAKGTVESVARLGSEGPDFGDRLAIDNDGNLLVAGRFNGTTNFLFDPNDNWFSNVTSEGSDLFVAKYAPELGNGSLIDLAVLGGPEDQTKVTGLLVDENNEVYVRGQFTKAIRVQETKYDSSLGPQREQSATTDGAKQLFFTKLNANLAPRWLTVLEADQEFSAENEGGLDYDRTSRQLLVIQDVTSAPTYHGQSLGKSPQGRDAYVLRIDGINGKLINHFLIGSPEYEDGKQIVSDQQGNYFVSGTFQSELTINQGGTAHTIKRKGTKNTFLAAFSTGGEEQADDRLVYLSGFSNESNLYASRGMTVFEQGSELRAYVPFVFDREAFGLDNTSLRPNASGTYDIFIGSYRLPSIPRISAVAPVRTGDRYQLRVQGTRLFSSSEDDFAYRMGEGGQAAEGRLFETSDILLNVPNAWVAGTDYPLRLSKSFYKDFYQGTVQIPPVVNPLPDGTSGTCEETLSIAGRYFGTASAGVKVFFDRAGTEVASATVSAVAPAQLQARVPGVYPETYQVRVRVNGSEAPAGNYRVRPAITQLSNATALPGATLSVRGCAFVDATHGINLLAVRLRQQGQEAIPVTILKVDPEQPDRLSITLPATLPIGTYALEVSVNGQVAAGDLSLEIADASTTQPLVTALSPDGEAGPGETITVTGKNLGSDPDLITVEVVEGQLLPVNSVNEAGTELTFVLPSDVPPGLYASVVVRVNNQPAVGTLSLRVVPKVAPPPAPTVTPAAENPRVYDPAAETLTLGARVVGATDTDEVLLIVTGLSGATSLETAAQRQEENYQATLTAEQLSDPLGFAYQFIVRNGDATRGASDPVHVYRQYSEQPMTLYKPDQAEPTPADYQLVAVPFRARNVRDAWTGPATFDADSIRLLRYQPGSDEYQEFGSGFQQFEPGRGYWLLKRAGVPLSVQGTAVEVDSARRFAIALQAGWNLIGNPFPFEIGLGWLGERDQRVFRSDRYAEATGTLKPYEGLFVESEEAVTLLVSATDNRNGRAGAGVSGISQFGNRPLDEAAWFVGLTATSGSVTNQLAGFGMHPQAQNGYDTYDATPMPRFEQFIEVQFDNALNKRKLERDIIPTVAQYTWTFAVEADPSAREVRLAWNNREWGQNDRELWLRDEATQQLINLREANEYSFRTAQSKRSFTLFYGPADVLANQLLPPRARVGAAYPNPATDQVALSLSVPEAEAGSLVSFTLVDATGRVIRHEQQRLSAGHHTLQWQRRDTVGTFLASGLYHYRVRVGARRFSGKIIYQSK